MNEKLVISVAAKIAMNFLFEFDEDEEEFESIKQHRHLVKTVGFFEKTVPRLNSKQFKGHFRLSAESFVILYREIIYVDSKCITVKPGRPSIDLEKQLLVTMWYLANKECFRSVADRFGISIKSCWTTVYYIWDMILKLNKEKKIIAWPNTAEANKTSDFFENKTKFPGVIGCIDGTHIPITAPHNNPELYINRKKFHSVLLQSVCNEDMIFTDCYTGEVGSIHDSCLFRRYNLYKRILNLDQYYHYTQKRIFPGSLVIPNNQHLLGDQGYSLKKYLMIPFKDNGSLTETQIKYNTTLSSARMTIERAFGLLKCRFRRLQKLETRRPDFIPLILMVCCIIHNFCLKHHDFIPYTWEPPEEVIDFSTEILDAEGKRKRNQVANLLM